MRSDPVSSKSKTKIPTIYSAYRVAGFTLTPSKNKYNANNDLEMANKIINYFSTVYKRFG